MENKRFRNHILSAFESISGMFIVLGFMIINIIINSIDEIKSIDSGDLSTESMTEMNVALAAFIVCGLVIILIFSLIIAWQIRIWYKTWITIGNGTISVERNTILLKKNTIGIKNISNVNTEQNLFEMIFGISTVKINTNSLSTANTTDMEIVLKKSEAMQLKQFLLNEMENANQKDVPEKEASDKTEAKDKAEVTDKTKTLIKTEYDIKAGPKDLIINSIFSINIVTIGGILIVTGWIIDMLTNILSESFVQNIENKLTIAVGIIFFIILIIMSVVARLVTMLFKLGGFAIKRENDKIFIKYGIIKYVNYSIPIDKINAIVIHQTLLARIFHKYRAELINVGMGDEKEEDTYFCFYCSKNKLLNTINTLLPEFADSVSFDVEKQPKQTMIIYLKNFLIMCAIIVLAEYIAIHFFDIPYANIVIGAGIFIAALIFLALLLSFYTNGMYIKGDYLNIRNGIFGTEQTVLKFDKIQYVSIYKTALAKVLGICRGSICILAMVGKNVETLPYFKKDKAEVIKKRLLKH